jgi:hypothetical protein
MMLPTISAIAAVSPNLRRAFPAGRLGSRTRCLLGNVNLVSHFQNP